MDPYETALLGTDDDPPSHPHPFPPNIDQTTQIRPHLVLTVMVLLVSTIGLAVHVRVSLKKAIIFILTLSIISTWANLYYIAAARKQAKLFNLSSQCFGGGKGWTRATIDSLSGFFFKVSDPCEDYFIAMMVDPFWEVSLLEAVTSLMVKSVGAVGNMAGAFFTSIVQPLPMFWRIPVLAAVIIIMAYLVRDVVRLKLQLYHNPSNSRTLSHNPSWEQIQQEGNQPKETLSNALTMETVAEIEPSTSDQNQEVSARQGKKPFGHSIKKIFKDKILKRGKSQK